MKKVSKKESRAGGKSRREEEEKTLHDPSPRRFESILELSELVGGSGLVFGSVWVQQAGARMRKSASAGAFFWGAEGVEKAQERAVQDARNKARGIEARARQLSRGGLGTSHSSRRSALSTAGSILSSVGEGGGSGLHGSTSALDDKVTLRKVLKILTEIIKRELNRPSSYSKVFLPPKRIDKKYYPDTVYDETRDYFVEKNHKRLRKEDRLAEELVPHWQAAQAEVRGLLEDPELKHLLPALRALTAG